MIVPWVDAVVNPIGTAGVVLVIAPGTGPGLGNVSAGTTGMGSAGTVLMSTDCTGAGLTSEMGTDLTPLLPNSGSMRGGTSLGSGLTRASVFGVWAAGMQSVGRKAAGMQSLRVPVMGVHAQGAIGAMSPFDKVTVGLSAVQMGCGGVTGLASRWGAGMGLAEGDRGLLDLLGDPFALGLMSRAGECSLLVLCAMSLVIESAIGL